MRSSQRIKKMNKGCQRHPGKNMEMDSEPEKSILSKSNFLKIKLNTDVWPNVFQCNKSNNFLKPKHKESKS
jgi:hypothetical protein